MRRFFRRLRRKLEKYLNDVAIGKELLEKIYQQRQSDNEFWLDYYEDENTALGDAKEILENE